MNTAHFYPIALVIHICGITLLAGITVTQWVLINHFFKQIGNDLNSGPAALKLTSRLEMFSGIGFMLLILSGVTMMWITHGIFGEQLWFRVKFALIILIIINALAVGRKVNKRIAAFLAGRGQPIQLKKIKTRANLFYGIQSGLFLTIYILSVFKFN